MHFLSFGEYVRGGNASIKANLGLECVFYLNIKKVLFILMPGLYLQMSTLFPDMEMFGKKKGKKKKSKPFSMDDLNDALPETKESTVTESEEKDPALAEVNEFDLDINFSKDKKKKSKKKKDLDVLIAEQEEASMDGDDKDNGKSCIIYKTFINLRILKKSCSE